MGYDLIFIEGVEKTYNKHGKIFLDKFLSPKEQTLIKNPTTLAGFWAAKEAASRVPEVGIPKHRDFLDITVSESKRSAPRIKFPQRTSRKFHIKKAKVSITHDKGLAIAIVTTK